MSLKKSYYATGFSLIVIIFLSGIFGFWESAELRALDLFRTGHNPHPDIAIAAIDNKSIGEIGRFPWDRHVYADFLAQLNKNNPRVVAFDINFSEKQNEINDNALKTAIENSKFPIILATEAVYYKNSKAPQQILKPIFSGLLGHVNAPESADGIIRKFPWYRGILNEKFEPIGFKVAGLVGADLPSSTNLLVNFAGGAGTFQTISFSDILNGKIPGNELKDKILLVGATASDLRDYLLVPVPNQVLSGIEWHANVIDNILLNRPITLLPQGVALGLGILLCLILLLLPFSWKNKTISIIFVAFILGLVVLSFLLWQKLTGLPYFLNLILLTSIYLLRSFYNWYQTEMEKRRLHKTIQNRFSPQVVNAIMHDPKLLKLGGERKEVTVLFSDIRGFTTLSESIKPETLSLLLHEYFTEMTEEVLATDGVLDKFIGDAVMAFWGAPIDQLDQADRAVKAALGMLERLKILQEKWKAQGLPAIDIGIGIHSGLATVGNMGSEKRFDYTVIGDTVNTASRLEGLNKEYKTHLIISEATKNKLTIPVQTKSLDGVIVKGKTQAVNIFEVN